MIFELYNPSSPIGVHIESLIYFKDFFPEHSLERVIPTGHVYIIFELDNIRRNIYDNDTLEPLNHFTQVWVSGAHKNYMTISAHQNSEMFVIQFKPSGAYPFLKFPLDQISNKVIQAEELFGKEIIALRSELMSTLSCVEKFKKAEHWLDRRFEESKQPPEVFTNVLKKIESQKGGSNPETLFSEYPFTRKHLISQFKKYVGLTPKYYQRLLKFNEILKIIQEKKSISWTQLTYEFGYSDQAHFIKTFKHFSGFSPKEFIFEGLDKGEANFFPIEE